MLAYKSCSEEGSGSIRDVHVIARVASEVQCSPGGVYTSVCQSITQIVM